MTDKTLAPIISSRSQELSAKADEERRRDWLLKFMRDKQPKFLTKEELRHAAMRELKVSKKQSNSPVAMIGMNRFAADIAPKANRGQRPGCFFPRCLMLRTEAICRLRDR